MKSKIIVNIKKLISVLICTMLIASTLPANSLNHLVSAATNRNVSSFEQLKDAVDNAEDGDVIYLTANIEIPSSATATEEEHYCVLNCSKNIQITTNWSNRNQISHNSPDGFLAITNGAYVTLDVEVVLNDAMQNSAVRIYDNGKLNLTKYGSIHSGTVRNGSMIYCENGEIIMGSNARFYNLKTNYEGIIYLVNSTFTFYGSISNCQALAGGAIYSKNSTLSLGGYISACSAGNGGAIYSESDSQINVTGVIENCHATGGGGAIYSKNSTTTFKGTLNPDNVALSSGRISDCYAGSGGAIFNDSYSKIEVERGGLIHNCYSDLTNGCGNAIYNRSSSNIYLPTSDINLFAINVPSEAKGTDNAQQKYGYDGIYDENHGKATMLYRVYMGFNGGVDSNNRTSTNPVLIKDGSTLGDLLPTDLTKTISGVTYNLYKWVDPGSQEVTSSTPITTNASIHARYAPPQIASPTLTKGSSGTTYTAGDWSNENITLSYSISSPEVAINPQRYKISLNGTDFNDVSSYSSSDTVHIDSTDASTLQFTIIKGGEYQIRIQASDSEGYSVTSDAVSVKIDKVIPLPVSVNIPDYSNVDTVDVYGTGEPGCTVTAMDENHTVIGTSVVDANGEWAITTSSLSDGEHDILVYQTDIAGNDSIWLGIVIIVDTTPPTGNINIGSNNFTQFLNTITFGLLFTETTNVTISASDDPSETNTSIISLDGEEPNQAEPPLTSGIKTIEYLKTDQVYSSVANIPTTADWQTGTISNNSISFDTAIPQNQLNDKFFIYARITDNAENETYLRSDGVILYTDSAVTTEEISHTKLDEQNKDLSVTLNGNTISSVTNGTNTLTKNTHYRIENNKIILRHEYLNSLAAGDYELKIHFAPAGETNLDPNLALPNSTVALYIEKASQQRPPEDAKFNNLQSSYTYGDNPGIISLNGGSGTGAVTYISTNPEVATINPTTGEINILKAGTFEIVATKAADDNYGQLVVRSDEIVVNRLNVTITGVTAQSKTYDGNRNAAFNITNAQINNLVNNDQVTIQPGTATFADKNVANGKPVIFSDFALSGNDASNYTLSAQPADTNANISTRPATVANIAIKDKIFDGSTTAEFDGNPTLENVIDGDDVTLTNGTPVFASASPGTSILVNFSTPFSLEGTDASNYHVTPPSNISGNIIAYEEDNASLESPESEDNIISGSFEAEDPATGIQVSAPEGVIPPWCILVVEEIYPNTDEYNETYEKLDSDKQNASERNKLYEIHLEDQDGNIVQPDTSKGLLTVRIPVPNSYDLDDLEIYRINEGPDDNFDENVVTVNNKNYCEYQTDHFSPYAMVDKSAMYYVVQSILPYLILFLTLLFVSLFVIIILKRRKDKE